MLQFPRDEAQSRADKLQHRVGHRSACQSDTLPRVLFVVAYGNAHVRAGREVQRAETNAIHHRRDAENLCGVAPHRSPQALISVANRNVEKLHVRHLNVSQRNHRFSFHAAWIACPSRNRCKKPVSTAPRSYSSVSSKAECIGRLVFTPPISHTFKAFRIRRNASARSVPRAIILPSKES